MSIQQVAAWLLRFKGKNGLCARYEQAFAELSDVESGAAIAYGHSGMNRSPSGTASDPTSRAALALMRRKEQLEADVEELARVIARAITLLVQCPFGQTVGDYYLDSDGRVTWASLAEEEGISTRAILKRRETALEWIASNWTLPD